MATRRRTLEFAFATQRTNVATNTTLGTTTFHEFAAIAIRIPEDSVTILSAKVEITARDAFTTARNVAGWSTGIKLGAVAFNDEDATPTVLSGSGDHELFEFSRDVTTYFVTNWAGPSTNAQVRFKLATQTAAENINNITAKLIITYSFDSTSATQVKMAWIPIQGELTTLGTTKTEIGGSGNSAATNQIPELDDFLPDMVSIEDAWIEVFANEAAVNTTDFNLFMEIDSAGETTLATMEQALGTSCYYHDIIDYDTSTHVTSSTHTLNFRSSLAARGMGICAILHVRYECDPNAARIQNSIQLLPRYQPTLLIPLSTLNDVARFTVDVLEPGTITIQQSGVLLMIGQNAAPAIVLAAGGQTARTYTMVATVNSGPQPILHRCDQGTSPWTLTRGQRQHLDLKMHATASLQGSVNQAVAYINYLSDAAPGGSPDHNHTTRWFGAAYQITGTIPQGATYDSSVQRTPSIGTPYNVSSFGILWKSRLSATAEWGMTLGLELLAGEYMADGWITRTKHPYNDAEAGTMPVCFDFTDNVNKTDRRTGRMAVDGARDVNLGVSTGHYYAYEWLLTNNNLEFEAAGTITGYAGDGSGIPVVLTNLTSGEVVDEAVSVAGGGFTLTADCDVDDYRASAEEDATHVGCSKIAQPVMV